MTQRRHSGHSRVVQLSSTIDDKQWGFMFIGHFGIGFGAKSAAPRLSLGTILVGAQFIDLLWPTLLMLGIERVQIVPDATTVTPLTFDITQFSTVYLPSWGGQLWLALDTFCLNDHSRGR